MPNCPSCASVTFSLDSGASSCISTYSVILDCTANPFTKVRTWLQHTPSGQSSWVDIKYHYDAVYKTYSSGATPPKNYLHEETTLTPDSLTNYTGGSIGFPHTCSLGANNYFMEKGSGDYRVKVEIEYSNGTICTQYSNTLAIVVGGVGLVDLSLSNACGCVAGDATYGTDAILALNYQAAPPLCPNRCEFEECPTFLLRYDGQVLYTLPEQIVDRTVELFDIGASGDASGGILAASDKRIYYKGTTAKYLTEVSYEWPAKIDLALSNLASQFKVGDYNYTLGTWTSGNNRGSTLGTGDRQRHINMDGPATPVDIIHGIGNGLQCISTGTAASGFGAYWGNNPPNYFSTRYGPLWDHNSTTGYAYGIMGEVQYHNTSPAPDEYPIGMCIYNLDPNRMANPEIVAPADYELAFMYPEFEYYDATTTNIGILDSGFNANLGVSSGWAYKVEPSGDYSASVLIGHPTIISLDVTNTFTSGDANAPCSGLADCPPYYHSTDINAPHSSQGKLKIINRFEYSHGNLNTNALAGSTPSVPSTLCTKLRMADGNWPSSGPSTGEGWYHIKAVEWSNEVYDTWNPSNINTPALDSGSTQHWAWETYGMAVNTLVYTSSSILGNNLQYEIYQTKDPHGAGTNTWRYGFDPFSCLINSGIIPHQVDEAGYSDFAIWDTASGCSITTSTWCSDPLALNYDNSTLPPPVRQGELLGPESCLFCDKKTGWVEGFSPGDDGPLGDIVESFKLVSVSTTPATYGNWGDGTITMTVERDLLFAANFPSNPTVNWDYKVELFRVTNAGDGWQAPNSYLIAGQTHFVSIPTITFANTTYPVPLAVPAGDYSVKWSIHVIDPGVYEIEECWWEYPVTVTATNPAPNLAIFASINVEFHGFIGFTIKVHDNHRASTQFNVAGPAFHHYTREFHDCFDGNCLDNGSVTGTIGTNITVYDAGNGINGGELYGAKHLCQAAGHTWHTLYDEIVGVEDITTPSYAPNSSQQYLNIEDRTQVPPFASGGHGGINTWEPTTSYYSYYNPDINWSSTPGCDHWHGLPYNSMYPSKDIELEVTWASGFSKIFTIHTPILYSIGGFGGCYPTAMPNQTSGNIAYYMVNSCPGEMWHPSQWEHNEPQMYQRPYTSQSFGNYMYYPHMAVAGVTGPRFFSGVNNQGNSCTFCGTSNSLWAGNQDFKSLQYLKVEEMVIQGPTYPYPVYEGMFDQGNLSSSGWFTVGQQGVGPGPYGLMTNLGTGNFLLHGNVRSNIEYGAPIFHAGAIIGGFTGEIQYKNVNALIGADFALNNQSLIPADSGTRWDAGGDAAYNNFITQIQGTTGAQNPNTPSWTSPQPPYNIPAGIGTANTLTEAYESNVFFADNIVYAKDCPVCLPPDMPLACRYSFSDTDLNGNSFSHKAHGWTNAGFDAIGISPFPFGALRKQYDDGSCMYCDYTTGKLLTDAYDMTDGDPPHWYFKKTNPVPYCSPLPCDLDVANLIEGTGNILDLVTGNISYGALNNTTVNELDSSTFLGETWYKMESPLSTYLGYANDTTDLGEIHFRANFWYQFIASATELMNISNFQALFELFYYDSVNSIWVSIETRTSNTYVAGQPTVNEVFDSNTASQNLTWGHYRLRVRALDTASGWTGTEEPTICYQDIHFNYRVQVCDTAFMTTDGWTITDANERFVNPSTICTCCPAVIPSAIDTGTACSTSRNIRATHNCTVGHNTTQIDVELFWTPACPAPLCGIAQSLGNYTPIVGAPVTTGSLPFPTAVTSNEATYGGLYHTVSTYTISGASVCGPFQSLPIYVAPINICDCLDTQATNYQQYAISQGSLVAGNVNCDGTAPGTTAAGWNSCCIYPSSCSAPAVTVIDTACNIVVSILGACTSGTPPSSIEFFIMDVSATGNIWDPANPTYTGASELFNVFIPAPSWNLQENCINGLFEITGFGGTGTYVVLQREIWLNYGGYTVDTASSVFTIGPYGTGTPPTGAPSYPMVCGCTTQVSGGITATNYNPAATCDDGSCIYPGCMDGGLTDYTLVFGDGPDGITASNYNSSATVDDGSCVYEPVCVVDAPNCAWERNNNGNDWCNINFQLTFNECNIDLAGNTIENVTSAEIYASFSTDNGTTWTETADLIPLFVAPTAVFYGSDLLALFTEFNTQALTSSIYPFECKLKFRVKTSYATSPDAYSPYTSEFIIMNPHSTNPYGWTLDPLDIPNLVAGEQTNMHNTPPFHHLDGYLYDEEHNVAGSPVVILFTVCGCTDIGGLTPSTVWTVPGVTPYTSPATAPATNVLPTSTYFNDPSMAIDDGTCIYSGCTDPLACNYSAAYTADCNDVVGGTNYSCCIYQGCMDPCAIDYNPAYNADCATCAITTYTAGITNVVCCTYPNPIKSITPPSLTPCLNTYTVTYEDIGNHGTIWGFNSVTYEIIYDPIIPVLNPTGTPVTAFASTTVSPAQTNYWQISLIDDCDITGANIFNTHGIGWYQMNVTVHYPGGVSCDVSFEHNWQVTTLIECGCLDCPACSNYNLTGTVTCDDGSCLGCTNPLACNYDPLAAVDDGSCYICGCTDATAANYNALATVDDGSCLYWHIWEKCGTSDRTSFGGGTGPNLVTLQDNQTGLNYINPLETIGETFQHTWWDGFAWVVDSCWEYIGTATGDNPAYYTNPLNLTTTDPHQWVTAAVATTYANCLACVPVLGCTDPLALNYNLLATIDDGSCIYPCCDAPTFAQAAGHVDNCDAEYVMDINCNSPVTDNADTITTILEFFDAPNSSWVTANTDVHNPGGTDNITSHSVTYHYVACGTDDFGGYGTGQYRITTNITYSSTHTCTHTTAPQNITLGIGGCMDPAATNYNSLATCQCVTCLFTYCCDTPVLTLDLTNGICNQSLECTVTCNPVADDGYTALWQSFATGSWVTIQTDTSSAATGSVTLTLANSLLHTASGTSENYRVVFTSDYTAPTPDCEVISNILAVTAPIFLCMDGGITEYNVTTGTPGDGLPDGLQASNYDPSAECDDGTCCIDGCTDPLANNLNWNTAVGVDVTSLGHLAATCDDGGCLYNCCTAGIFIVDNSVICYPSLKYTSDFSACPATVTSMKVEFFFGLISVNVQTYAAPVTATDYLLSNTIIDPYGDGIWTVEVTYTFGGTTIPDCTTTLTTSITHPIWGCTNSLSSNYNPAAQCDDNSCLTPVPGCDDPNAVNYNPSATYDDGTCLYCGSGCTDAVGGPYSNYPSTPTPICDCDNVWLQEGYCDNGSGTIIPYYDPTACTAVGGGANWVVTYNNNTTSVTWNSCCLPCTYGCTDNTWNNYNPLATCDCTELLGIEPCDASTQFLTGANCCCTSCIYGCTDSGSQTQSWWDGINLAGMDYATATGFTTYPLASPNNLGAVNYNNLATCEDGSCLYAGCTDCGTYWETANGAFCNGVSAATSVGATNYNPIFAADCARVTGGTDYSCCTYPVGGCTDSTALNTTPGAMTDDGSCMYCDAITGNYEDAAGIDQAPWATGISNSTATSTETAIDGSLFVNFTLSSVGLIMQSSYEFQSGNNNFAIELYSVATNGAASGTGVLIATSPAVPAATSTIIAHNFTGLAYGYYAVKLIVQNGVGNIEPEECFIEISTLVQAYTCTDPVAANTTTIPLDLQLADLSQCIYPGYCACIPQLTALAGTPCSSTATINATVNCVVSTDIAWSWQDSNGNTLLSGTTTGITISQIVSSLPITSNGTYTFIYDETSTPYNTCPQQTVSISSNVIAICGCTDNTMGNYNPAATYDCNGDPIGTQNPGWNAPPCCLTCIYGCMSVTALNYNSLATCDDGSCIEPGDGCCDPLASNYNSAATNCVPALCEYCND